MRTGADRVFVQEQPVWTRARGLHRTLRVARITRDGSESCRQAHSTGTGTGIPESRWIASEARLTLGDAMRRSGAHRANSTPPVFIPRPPGALPAALALLAFIPHCAKLARCHRPRRLPAVSEVEKQDAPGSHVITGDVKVPGFHGAKSI
ncbi:hypothetical protein C8R45DRAFT_1160601 [Mycena sanguinolenta]|nr:hypothetical protein C8R45DRAFT_1160601 [Mycena sanguinolenta]